MNGLEGHPICLDQVIWDSTVPPETQLALGAKIILGGHQRLRAQGRNHKKKKKKNLQD